MRRVVIESPSSYAGNAERNKLYAYRCMRHSLKLGEAPFLGHLLYAQVLDDSIDRERNKGIDVRHAWIDAVPAVVIYEDLGITIGMRLAIAYAQEKGIPVEYRKINP